MAEKGQTMYESSYLTTLALLHLSRHCWDKYYNIFLPHRTRITLNKSFHNKLYRLFVLVQILPSTNTCLNGRTSWASGRHDSSLHYSQHRRIFLVVARKSPALLKHRHWPWSPHSLLIRHNGALSLSIKWPRCGANHAPPSSTWVVNALQVP
jgi:hypothetical protein